MSTRTATPRSKPRASAPTPKFDKARQHWYFVFDSVQPQPDGRRRQVKRGGYGSRGEAKVALAQAIADDRVATSGDGMTVAAVLAQFVRTKKLAGRAPGTVAFHEWAASHASARWGGWPADTLTADHLDAAYLEMLAGGRKQHARGKGTATTKEPLSPRSVEAMHKTLKAAFALAINKGQLVRNPAALATPPAQVEPKRSWWTPAQVGQFLAYVAGLDKSPLPAATIELLVDTGGRRGEALGLRWADVDLDAGTATIARQMTAHPETKELAIRPTKRKRSKATIGLHPATVVALRQRRAQQNADRLRLGKGWPADTDNVHGDLIFTWPDGRVIHPDTLTTIVARLSTKSGLPRLTPHGLRHSFASAALSAGERVEVVAARLGNTPRVVQEVYAHVIPADDQATAQLVGDLYRSSAAARL